MALKSNTDDFIRKAKEKYGEMYDYSLVDYKKKDIPVTIGCKIHGLFQQTPHTHLRPSTIGCPKCAEDIRRQKRSLGKDSFIKKAIEVHGDKYDYSNVEYVNNLTDVTIICPLHGEFRQAPSNHLAGKGCWRCGRDTTNFRNTKSTEDFIKKAKEVHGDKYDYSESVYTKSNEPITIICPTHGKFEQTPTVHLLGCGCQECGKKSWSEQKILTTEEFIRRSNNKHCGKYSYEKSVYVRHDVPIIVTCKEHGDFKITPGNHIKGGGCPKCSKANPLAENELFEEIKMICKNIEVQKHVKGLLCGREEIDIYIPKLKIGIEYNGLIWHSERFNKKKEYHLSKTNNAIKNGIELIHIFEDEYINKKDIVIGLIKDKLLKNETILFSSQYYMKEIDTKNAVCFYERFSLVKYKPSTINIGVFKNDNELIAIMSLKKTKDTWKVNDLVKNFNYNIINIEENVFNYFLKKYKPSNVSWPIDRRFFPFGLNKIENIGFKVKKITQPNTYYTNKGKRINEYEFKKASTKLKFYKIYDSGNIIYTWEKEGS